MALVKRQAVRTALAWLLATQAPLLASCGTKEHTERSEQTTSAEQTPPASMPAESLAAATPDTIRPRPSSATTTEPAILDILRTVNTIAIRSARLARARSASDAVQAYAVQIADDHTAANRKLDQLATRLGVKPQSNPTSRMLTTSADHARASFEAKRGAVFDRAYIESEIGFQRQFLDLLDRSLIPAAPDSEMKALLQTQRATVEAHLDHANHAQSALAP